MIAVHLVRVVRFVGWVVLTGSVGVVLAVTLFESIGDISESLPVWPDPRLWRYFLTTILMAGVATVAAFILALPAAVVLALTQRGGIRRTVAALTIIPLVTMPSLFAYAWMLLATRQNGMAGRIMNALGWSSPGGEWLQAAVVFATWLWPIPALVMSASFSRMGQGGYQLARLDATGVMALVRGALPSMRAPLVAALAITFILCANESSIPPLMGATEVWAVEMMALASASGGQSRPAGYLFWQSCPMLLLIALALAAAVPGLRQMTKLADSPDSSETGEHVRCSRRVRVAVCLFVAAAALFPVVVFMQELSRGRASAGESIETAYRTFRSDGLATALVGSITAIGGVAAAFATLRDSGDRSMTRFLCGLGAVGAVVTAVLPPELVGTALASFYSRISDPASRWSVYDCTPLVWSAATISRYAFLPIVVASLLNRCVPESLLAQARTDGCTRQAILAQVRLPFLWLPTVAAGMLAGCLAMSEVSSSLLVQPPRFFGGSLAVMVDMQMHYGRQDETVALAAMMLAPAIIGAWVGQLLFKKWRPANR